MRGDQGAEQLQGEIAQVAQAIEVYKIDKGFYPPDNLAGNGSVRPYPNSLYYELGGANYDRQQDRFTTLGGNEVVRADELLVAFNTRGINNAGMPGNTDGPVAKNYLPDIKPAHYAVLRLGAGGDRKVLAKYSTLVY